MLGNLHRAEQYYFNNISWVKHRNSSLKFLQQAKICNFLMDQVRELFYIFSLGKNAKYKIVDISEVIFQFTNA